MKQLQNNFTTPEQSKRLLELGVPADSADCFYTRDSIKTMPNGALYSKYSWIISNGDDTYPCFSVGRLIEIYVIARGVDTVYLPVERGEDIVKYLIRLYEEKVKDLDFSKLEE